MQVVSVSQLRSNIKKYVDDISKSQNTIIVSRNSEDEAVVIMSLREYNSLNETGYLLSTDGNRNRLKNSINQLQKNQTHKFDL